MNAAENKAVILSCSSQEPEAARRMCDELCAVRVEVRFDADGGFEFP